MKRQANGQEMNKVLLVDDNKDILAMWQMFLNKQNISSEILSSSKEFLDYKEANGLNEVGCIVCDESLQDGLGTDLYSKVRSEGIDTDFIIVSGYSPDEILSKVTEKENLKVLKKPISLAELKQVILQSLQT